MFNILFKNTEYTNEEWKIYQKVDKHNKLEDLKFILENLIEGKAITQEEYKTALSKADIIIERYDKYLDYNWQETMRSAIEWVTKE